MEYNLEKLRSGIKTLGIDATDEQINKFENYISLLIQWNQKMNLTAITEPDEIIVDHFLDSIAIIKDVNIKDGDSMLDVGTGAGFPGIPIKIMKPGIELVLLDSLRKRTEFLAALVKSLELKGVEIHHSRAEDLAKSEEFRGKFDWVVSRAVAPLNILAEYCIPFVKIRGFFISYKGPAAYEEMEDSKNPIKILGGDSPPTIKSIKVPFSVKTRNLILIQKATKTPNKYPRSPGKIKKSPL